MASSARSALLNGSLGLNGFEEKEGQNTVHTYYIWWSEEPFQAYSVLSVEFTIDAVHSVCTLA